MQNLEATLRNIILKVCAEHPDPSHDILHVERVVKVAQKMGRALGAKLEVITPAAYLHDCVYIDKGDVRRAQASRLSADRALEILRELEYPEIFLAEIHHAILAHSFSANIAAETLEAKIIQDADRLDAIGVVGAFRCFIFSGIGKRPMYHAEDPFCHTRTPNDRTNSLDHFYVKLIPLVDKLQTEWAKAEGARRLHTMREMLSALERELSI